MIYINEKEKMTLKEKSAVTLGKFDGFHMGHQLLLDDIIMAKSQGLVPVVFTFGVKKNIQDDKIDGNLMTEKERIEFLKQYGIDVMVSCPFDEQMRHMAPEQFIREILSEKLHAKRVVVGEDFRFGYQREGNVETLKQYAAKYSYEVIDFKRLKMDQEVVSSSMIREQLLKGNMEKVTKLMGRPYLVEGTVVYGNQIGRKLLGLPTANIYPSKGKLLPPNGVYIANVHTKFGWYKGVSNIGYKPTIGGETRPGVETNLFDFDDDLYGSNVLVEFLSYERKEQKFTGLEELKQQMTRDKQNALTYFAKLS